MSARTIGLAIIFVWFMAGGIGHFVATDVFVGIMPPYIPYHREAVYLTGALEIIGAILVLLPSWRAAAGLGLFMLTIAVTPANVHMWLNPHLWPTIPNILLTLRLVLQVLLLACIWWVTQTGPRLR